MAIRASVATRDITPQDSVPLYGHPGVKRMSSGVGTPLLVSAVHLRGGSGGILLLSLDLLFLDPGCLNAIRRKINAATGIRDANIFIGTTQNHSGPVSSRPLYWFKDPSFHEPDPAYIELVTEQCVQAASESAVASRVASVAVTDLGPSGNGVILVKDNTSGRIMAAIVVYPDIADYLGSQNTEISADFVHFARQKLTARFGGNPVLAFFPGQTGDRRLHGMRPNVGTAESAGKALADAIVARIKALSASDFSTNILFAGKFTQVDFLPRKELPGEAEAAITLASAIKVSSKLEEDTTQESQKRLIRWTMIEASGTLNLAMAQKGELVDQALADYTPLQIQALQIGPVRLLGIPGKVMPGCCAKIGEIAGQRTWLAECVGGDLIGSILVPDEANPDTCVLWSSIFAPTGGGTLAHAAVTLAADPTL